jgi:hypothetical protein
MTHELRAVNLQLEIEDLEARPDRCCGSSTTSHLCTCPIFLTDCCDRLEYSQQQ